MAVMPRPPRLRICGATYHVMARGNRKSRIFLDEADRRQFRQILSEACSEFEVVILVECQMGTHYHVVPVTPRGNLSEFMRELNGRYAQYWNRRHKHVGHVFQGPFKAVLIEHDIHLLNEIAYVLKNPVVEGRVARPEDWKWSSYKATVGLSPVPSYLSLSWLDVLFQASSRRESQRLFSEAMKNSRPVDSYLEQHAPAVGSERFSAAVRSFIGEQLYQSSLPRSYRALSRPELGELFAPSMDKQQRALMIQRARVVHGYKVSEIARTLALHPASVSRIVCQLRRTG